MKLLLKNFELCIFFKNVFYLVLKYVFYKFLLLFFTFLTTNIDHFNSKIIFFNYVDKSIEFLIYS